MIFLGICGLGTSKRKWRLRGGLFGGTKNVDGGDFAFGAWLDGWWDQGNTVVYCLYQNLVGVWFLCVVSGVWVSVSYVVVIW